MAAGRRAETPVLDKPACLCKWRGSGTGQRKYSTQKAKKTVVLSENFPAKLFCNIFLQALWVDYKQGECTYKLSWSIHNNFVRDCRYSERGWGMHPPTPPGWANFSIMMESTSESDPVHPVLEPFTDSFLLVFISQSEERFANKFRKSQICGLTFFQIGGPSANVAVCGFAICGPNYFLQSKKQLLSLQIQLKMLSFKFWDDFWLLGQLYSYMAFPSRKYSYIGKETFRGKSMRIWIKYTVFSLQICKFEIFQTGTPRKYADKRLAVNHYKFADLHFANWHISEICGLAIAD